MPVDVNQVLGAVARTLSSRDVGGEPARVITLRRSFPAPAEDVWEALTTAERIPRWFLPITGDLRPGGRYQLEGNAGGEILKCDPPRRLEITWEMHGQASWVNVTLSEDQPGTTRMEMEHVAHVPGEFWDQFGPGAVGVGWDSALLGMDQYFSDAPAVDPQSAIQWLASEEGRRFLGQSSDAWCAASIAAGTDAAAAAAAAARTTAFYTGDTTVPAEA